MTETCGCRIEIVPPLVRKIVYCPLHQAAPAMREALLAAKAHLDYTGYGDSYERECARDAKLEERIDAALALTTHTPERP